MVKILEPKIETVELKPDGTYGKFVADPLDRGFGITLGNSLRRVLLSSLPGVAVSSVKIEGEIRDPWSLDRSAFEAKTRDLNEEG